MAYESNSNARNNRPSGEGWFWESYQDAGWRRKVDGRKKVNQRKLPKNLFQIKRQHRKDIPIIPIAISISFIIILIRLFV